MMINGPNDNELVFGIIKSADFAQLCSMNYFERSRLSTSLKILLTEDPSLIGKLIFEGLKNNITHVKMTLSLLIPDYLDKVLSTFTLSDLTSSIKDGPNKGINALYWFALAASNGETIVLRQVIYQFKDQFTAVDFTGSAQDGPTKGKSVLSHLTEGTSYSMRRLLLHVLGHVTFDLQTLINLSKEKLPEEAHNLVTAKIILATILKHGIIDEQFLFKNAEAAMLAGCRKAYHELGEYFEKMNMTKQAARSFLLMPDNSNYLEPICNEYSARFIGVATEAVNSLEKLSHLDTALKFALKINDDEKRHATLQTIARIYINQSLRNGIDVGNEVIPPHLLEVMHGQIDSSWCFKVFQQLAETVQLKLSNKKLTEKLEKSKSKRALEQETRELLEPIKELLIHFEDEKRQAAEKTKRARPNEAEDHNDLCLDTDGPKEALTKMMSM